MHGETLKKNTTFTARRKFWNQI